MLPPLVLIRLVRMTLAPDRVDDFLSLFDATSPSIRAFPGCSHLELWRDDRFPNIVTTYSIWTDDAALDHYRRSDLFRSTWSRTKPMFAAAPVATSMHRLRSVSGGPHLA